MPEQVSSIGSICKLHGSQRFDRVLRQITEYISKPRDTSDIVGTMESDPEYQLIVEVNSIAVEIDHEICKHEIIANIEW